ncbi:metallophosphoesterase [Streptomyces sp. NPDC006450]|uniref:metallophosphoesterase family protein n=1 Tax=Streptomyces sp. NPDC006450 TaxID=3155458 RepID=UPI0033A97FDF
MHPASPDDWLVIAGDVGEILDDVAAVLRLLADRFDTVIWAPGNHELWTHPQDPVQLRGEARYRRIVEICRGLGVLTPEDPYPVWDGPGGPLRIAPLFVLYDYSFLPPGCTTKDQALARAYESGAVCSDEFLLHPDPYPSREAWCRARVAETEARLDACPKDVPLLLVNHYPLVREPTDILYFPEFAQWCGTRATADWHTRYPVQGVVYGHLHIPRTTVHDGVPFHEVSLGYPREWRRHGRPPGGLHRVRPTRPEVAR